jgi:hypothetical protein
VECGVGASTDVHVDVSMGGVGTGDNLGVDNGIGSIVGMGAGVNIDIVDCNC